MEENQDNEDNGPRVEDTPVEDVGGVAKQPATHLMEVDLSGAQVHETVTKADVDVQLQSSYLCTLPGFLRILQVLISVGALICVTSTTFDGQSYLMNPGAWRFRVFIFTSVVSILASFLLLMTHASTIHRMMPIDWLLLDIGICGILTFLYLVTTAMIGAVYREYSNKSRVWLDRNILLAGMILGFFCFGLYGLHLTTLLLRWRKRGQFQHRSLQLEDRRSGSIVS